MCRKERDYDNKMPIVNSDDEQLNQLLIRHFEKQKTDIKEIVETALSNHGNEVTQQLLNQENESLRNETAALKHELSNEKTKSIEEAARLRDECNEKVRTLETQFADKEAKYCSELSEEKTRNEQLSKEAEKARIESERLAEEKEDFLKKYGCIIEAYEKFLSLNNDTFENLNRIFVSRSFECFISSCFLWENIEGLWGFLQWKAIQEYDNDAKILNDIFLFMISGYNARFTEPKYDIINPSSGTKYNSDEHVIQGIKTDGIISSTILVGYKMHKGKVIKKAVVNV